MSAIAITTNHKRGATLLEVVIIAFIVGTLVVIGVRAYVNFLNSQSMNAAVEHIVGILQRARNYTLASYGNTGASGKNYGVAVDIAADSVTLFESNAACGYIVAVAGPEKIPSDIDIIFAGFPIVFQQISGDAKKNTSGCSDLTGLDGYVILQSRRGGNTKTVRVLPLGVVQVE